MPHEKSLHLLKVSQKEERSVIIYLEIARQQAPHKSSCHTVNSLAKEDKRPNIPPDTGGDAERGPLAKVVVTGLSGAAKGAAPGPATRSSADRRGETTGLAEPTAGEAANSEARGVVASTARLGEAASRPGLLVALPLGPSSGVSTVGERRLSEDAGPEVGETPGGVKGRTTSLEIGVLVRGADAGEVPSKPLVCEIGALPSPVDTISNVPLSQLCNIYHRTHLTNNSQ